MVTVPVAENRVGIADVTDAKLRTPDMSGVGEGLARGLQSVGAGGQELAHAFKEHAQQLEETGAKLVDANAMRDIIGAQSEFQSLEGVNAANGLNGHLARLDKVGNEALASATTPAMRRRIEPIIIQRIAAAKAQAQEFALSQGRAAATDAARSRLSASKDMALASTSDTAFNQNIDAGMGEVEAQATQHGADPLVGKETARLWAADVYYTRAQALTSTGHLDEARSFVDANKQRFTGEQLERLGAVWQPMLDRRTDNAAVDARMGSVTPEGAATNFTSPLRDAGGAPVHGGQYGAPRTYHGKPGTHEGVDIPAPLGTPVYSSHGAGTATVSHTEYGGTIVTIHHDDGYVTKYDHLSATNIPANGRVDSTTRIGAVGVTGRSTGPHLHYEVVGPDGKHVDPTHIATAVRQGPQPADMGRVLDSVDADVRRGAITFEAGERQKSVIRERVGIANQVREQGYQAADDAMAQWLLKHPAESVTSLTQVPANLQAGLRPERLLEYRNQFQNNLDRQNAAREDLGNFQAMISAPGFAFNPYDDKQRKAVEAGVYAQGGTPMAAFNVWQRTGILAKSGAVALRGGLVSVDPTQVGTAANIAGNMIRRNPNAFAGVEGREDIEHAAVAYNHYVYDLGMQPQQAAARVAKENDPAFKTRVKLGAPERDQFMKGLRQQGLSAAQALGGQFYSTSQAQEADQTYAELTMMAMDRGADVAGAQAQAKAQMARVYGVTRDGHITKYAPERGYPAVNGSHDYVYHDAAATVLAETHLKPAQVTDVHIVPIPGVTDQDFRAGAPPRYQLLYGHLVDGQKVYNVVPGQWAADVHSATAKAAVEHERSMRAARAASQERAATMNPLNASGRARPSSGPGSNPLEDQ